MNIIQENSLLIIGILLILLLFLAGLIIYIHRHASEKYNSMKTKYEKLKKEHSSLLDKFSSYKDIESKYLKQRNTIDELKREIAEQNKLLEKEPACVEEPQFTTVIVSDNFSKLQNQEAASKQEQPKQEQAVKEAVPVTTEIPSSETITMKEESPVVLVKEVIMYASFPRSAGSRIYFSDLTENLADDSFFELKISNANGKATFKPLDFMKIRNYDPAMAAMLTNGVKPNVASTVLGIEPGKAHIEGKDWIIDNPAKIKLA